MKAGMVGECIALLITLLCPVTRCGCGSAVLASQQPTAMPFSSGAIIRSSVWLNCTPVRWLCWVTPTYSLRMFPLVTSHSFTTLSFPEESTYLPLRENCTLVTSAPECASSNVFTQLQGDCFNLGGFSCV